MNKWEYKIYERKANGIENEEKFLNDMGQECWEFVGVLNPDHYLFKRELRG